MNTEKRLRSKSFYLLILVITSVLGAHGCASKGHVRPGHGVAPEPSPLNLRRPVSSDQFKEARTSIEGKEFTRRNAESFMTVAQYHFNQGQYQDALDVYQQVVTAATGGPVNAHAQYMVGHCYYERKEYIPALSAFQKTLTNYPTSTDAASARQMIDFIIEYALSREELQSFLNSYPDSPARCNALFQLGRRESEDGLGSEAVDHLNVFLKQCPGHPSVTAANLLLNEWKDRQKERTRTIGVLVPLTGRYSAFGTSVINGVNLALAEENSSSSRADYQVLASVKDTKGDAVAAVHAFKSLIQEGNVDVIIGPVTSGEIGSVAPMANEAHIVLLSPSASREGLATLGPFIFRNSMTNEMQGRAIAKYALEELGLKKFAILAPEDGYGEALAGSFRQEIEAHGGTITANQFYYPRNTDFKRQILELGGFDPSDLKESERENIRRAQQLEYTLQKEVRKLLLAYAATTETEGAVALVPLPEGLTNTVCPSIAPDVRRILKQALDEASKIPVRKEDLVEQSLSRLPEEYQGTTLVAQAEDWTVIMQEVQSTLLMAGRIVETDPPDEWGSDNTWDYVIELEAWWPDPQKHNQLKTTKSRIPYSLFKAPEIIRRPVTYEALYLPAHTLEVPLLMTQIRFYDLEPVLLGGHLWEDPSVLKDGGGWEKGAYFVTGFFVDSSNDDVRSFVKRYQQQYASKPDLLAAQAYDAARLVLKALKGASGGDEVRRHLSSISGFQGVSGETSFRGNGEAEKKVPILKIEDGKFKQVQ